jgi:hypothetical protein
MNDTTCDVDVLVKDGDVSRRAAERAAQQVAAGVIPPAKALEWARREDAAIRGGVSLAAARDAFPSLENLDLKGSGFRWG